MSTKILGGGGVFENLICSFKGGAGVKHTGKSSYVIKNDPYAHTLIRYRTVMALLTITAMFVCSLVFFICVPVSQLPLVFEKNAKLLVSILSHCHRYFDVDYSFVRYALDSVSNYTGNTVNNYRC